MSDISRKALIEYINSEIMRVRFGLMAEPDNDEPLRAEFGLLQRLLKIVESFPSTESEREATRLREALEKILTVAEDSPVKTYQRMEDISREALSSHREGAEAGVQKLQALYEKYVGSDDRKTRGIALGVKLASEALGIYISNGGQSNE